ncbi:MAG TPA: alpha/beta fold hydrolase [Phycisphaerae bacterium]|nr:alpha/beta fold hydrolase [Phycisphaerae bacterium]
MLRPGIALLCLQSIAGCGGFLVDEGIFPLPTIHLVYPVPSQIGIDFKTIQIESPSGPMFGWFIPAENARGTVFINHGAVMNRSSYLSHYQLLHGLGYHVFTYDYQGFGENFSVATIETVLGDAERALGALQLRTEPGTEKIIIFGLSMGTLPSIAQAATNPDRVVGLMLEGSFLQESLPASALFFMGITPSPLAYNHIPAELDADTNVMQITLPKLFLHARDDEIAPFDSAMELYEIALEPKFFVPLSGLHVFSILVDHNYGPRIQEFLDAVTADP